MKKKIKFYRALIVELIETLCSICLYLESDSRYNRNSCGMYMKSHFNELQSFSRELRKKDNKYIEVKYDKNYRK